VERPAPGPEMEAPGPVPPVRGGRGLGRPGAHLARGQRVGITPGGRGAGGAWTTPGLDGGGGGGGVFPLGGRATGARGGGRRSCGPRGGASVRRRPGEANRATGKRESEVRHGRRGGARDGGQRPEGRGHRPPLRPLRRRQREVHFLKRCQPAVAGPAGHLDVPDLRPRGGLRRRRHWGPGLRRVGGHRGGRRRGGGWLRGLRGRWARGEGVQVNTQLLHRRS
jgi:hypothetical protein